MKSRLNSIDTFRGASIVAMIIYHLTWDLSEYFMLYPGLESKWPMILASRTIGLSFTLIAGISIHLSKKPLAHGIKILLLAIGLTFVTHFVTPTAAIYFGVLHLLGCSIILTALMRPILNKLSRTGILITLVTLFIITFPTAGSGMLKSLNILSVSSVDHPILGFIISAIGFPSNTFTSADYYPLLPWIFPVMFGYAYSLPSPQMSLGKIEQKIPKIEILSALGQYSLPIYLLHQPIMIGVLTLFFR
ncbi:MAG: DUF1624 domain-containing protein [Tissierellia bacterium]|nr:DUF1624 domain-containing protein [Tissierellia bacterium]